MLGLYAKKFAGFLATSQGRLHLERLDAKRHLFREKLDRERLEGLSPQDFVELFSSLDCLAPGEGRRIAEAMVETHGMEAIREVLKFLVHTEETTERRFEEALARFGEAPQVAIMEFLTCADPEDFCIWDAAARQAVRLTGQAGLHGLTARAFIDPIGPLEYVQAFVALNHLRELLNSYLQRKADFLDVHLFCLYITGAVPQYPMKEGGARQQQGATQEPQGQWGGVDL